MARLIAPVGGTWPVQFGTAELMGDLDRPGAWLLLVNGVAQSYVDLEDPLHLEFDYVRWIADVVDALPEGPVTAVHLGGGGCTLARYVAATRPGSTQVVVEADAELADLVRSQLGTQGFRLRVGDGREALSHLSPASSDLLVADVFVGAVVPTHLATLEFVREVAAVLTPGGVYVANVADVGAMTFVKQQVAALREVFEHVLLMAEPGVLRRRRFGNIILLASNSPLPEAHLRRVAARAMGRATVVAGDETFVGGVRPATDAAPPVSPTPPAGLFGRP